MHLRAKLGVRVAGFALTLMLSLCGVWGAFWLLTRFQTRFAEGFSEERFFQLRPGQTVDDVIAILGNPISCLEERRGGGEIWEYASARGESAVLREKRERIFKRMGQNTPHYRFSLAVFFDGEGRVMATPDIEPFRWIQVGSSRADVEALAGPPRSILREPDHVTVCSYSGPQHPDANYEWWHVVFDERGRLISVNLELIVD